MILFYHKKRNWGVIDMSAWMLVRSRSYLYRVRYQILWFQWNLIKISFIERNLYFLYLKFDIGLQFAWKKVRLWFISVKFPCLIKSRLRWLSARRLTTTRPHIWLIRVLIITRIQSTNCSGQRLNWREISLSRTVSLITIFYFSHIHPI